MRLIPFFIILVTGSVSFGHPLHLSVTNITYESRQVKITMKTFRDDWEVAYFHFHSRAIDFSEPENRNIPWLRDYLEQSFLIAPGKTVDPYILKYDTVIVNDKNMVIELHADVQEEPKSLYLYNTILTDIFPDQTNLVIIGFKNRETGIKFDIRKHAEEIDLVKH